MTAVEFTRLVALDTIGDGIERSIAATPAERAALARRFDLRALDSLEARIRIAAVAGGVRVTGRVEADVTQACIISDEDVSAHIEEPFDLMLLRDAASGDEVELGEGDCDVLPLDASGIDLGEIAAQSLGLALDPYPRAEAAITEAARQLLVSEEEARAAANPFAKLRRP